MSTPSRWVWRRLAGRHACLGAYHTLVDLMICCRLFSLIGAVWAAGVDMKRDANLYFIMFSCPANSRGADGKVSSAACWGGSSGLGCAVGRADWYFVPEGDAGLGPCGQDKGFLIGKLLYEIGEICSLMGISRTHARAPDRRSGRGGPARPVSESACSRPTCGHGDRG